MKKISCFFLLCLGLVGCVQKTPEPIAPPLIKEPIEESQNPDPVYIEADQQKNVSKPILPTIPVASTMEILGETEPIFLTGMKRPLAGRIDTGATTSSINALEIKPFERDGKSWVSFVVVNKDLGEKKSFEKRISRTVSIKRHGEESQKRIVVKLEVLLGKKKILREFSLTDRSSFEFPILIGRNVLSGMFAVDVSRKNITSVMQEDNYDN